ncbi:MAG: MMPL family transporter [Gemmatimonadales bacterium]
MIPLPASLIVRWRWPIVALWIVLVALIAPVASEVHARLQVGGQNMPGSESTRAENLVRDQFSNDFTAFGVVVVKSDSLIVSQRRYAAYIDSLTVALQRLPFVLKTLNWRQGNGGLAALKSDDGHIAVIIAGLRQINDNDPTSYTLQIREAVDSTANVMGAGFETHLTGGPAFDFDTRLVTAEDSRRLERAVIPLSLLFLVIVFGTLVSASVPIVVAFIAIEITLGLIAMIATWTPMSIFVLNITTMVGLGVGIDYSLLIVTRFREELAGGRTPHDAAEATIKTAGQAVITSGATVMVGLVALLVVPLHETRSVGTGGLLVVGTSILLSISFLPAGLAILGHKVEWPHILARITAPLRSEVGWMRYAASLARHPIRAIIISGGLLLVFIAPVSRLRIGLPVSGWFPKETEAGRGLALLEQMRAGGSLQPIRVVLHTTDGSRLWDADRLRGLKAVSDAMYRDPRVRLVRSLVDVSPGIPLWQYILAYADTAKARARSPDFLRGYLSRDGTAALYDVVLADSVTLDGSLDAVRNLRRIDVASLPTLQHAELMAGGFAPSSLDFRDELLRRFPLLVLLVLGVTGVMLGLVFKSVLVPIKAVIMNCFSVAAAFGMTVVVFQWGIGSKVIGLDGPTKAVFVLGPVLVFAIVFGLSMDYEVFLLSRIKEEFDRSHDNDSATIAGLAATGATITNAALIMILVFGAFAFARVLAVQMVGFGLAVAVLLDATVIRMVMVPSVMHLAGRFNWWPGYRRRHGASGDYRRGSKSTLPPPTIG